jgi:hypothetical protein
MALSFMHSNSVEDMVELCFRCLDLNGDGEISKGMSSHTASELARPSAVINGTCASI